MDDSQEGDRPDTSNPAPPASVPVWLQAILDRMRAENPDLFGADGRPLYDPDAPEADERGVRILHAFGSAALAQLAEAFQVRLKARPSADPTRAAASDQEFRDELTALLTRIVQDLRGTLQRHSEPTGAAAPEPVRDEKEAHETGAARSDQPRTEVDHPSDP